MKFYVRGKIDSSKNDIFPCIVLIPSTWNDYGYETSFNSYLYFQYGLSQELGKVKILHKLFQNTRYHIDSEFLGLSEFYISLGQSMEYYSILGKLPRELSRDILTSLRDIAYNNELYELFPDKEGISDSLLRSSEARKTFNSAMQFFGAQKKKEVFVFNYKYCPPYSNEKVTLKFDFSENEFLPNRAHVLVGKNGCGKTQFMAGFANSLCGGVDSKEYSSDAFDEMPLFSKVIGVSFSAFDEFKKPHQNENKNIKGSESEQLNNYIYCGIQGKDEKTLSLKELSYFGEMRLKELMKDTERFFAWKNIMLNVLEEEFKNLVDEPENIFRAKLSSGQSILIYTMTNVISNIEEESILLFDEPELHLHPNAISNLMRMLSELLAKYNSYAIISTHSPLIIQEVPSRNITKFTRVNNALSIDELTIESFGENLSSLNEEVFNIKDVESNYKTILRNAVIKDGRNSEDIKKLFPLGLSYNAMIYLNIVHKNQQRNI